MSRAVSLRFGGHAIEGRLALHEGRAALEIEGRRVEAGVSREGRWIELTTGTRTVRAAAARDSRGIWVTIGGRLYLFEVAHRPADARGEAERSGEVLAPMTGRVAAVAVGTGAVVRDGDLMLTIEAMKMEFKVTAPTSGTVREMACAPGDRVELGQRLVRIDPDSSDAAPGEAS